MDNQTARQRPVGIPQEMIRAAALAMRENFSNDTFALARVALRAAIPNQAVLRDLVEQQKTGSRPGLAIELPPDEPADLMA